jgi:hypothetical protein
VGPGGEWLGLFERWALAVGPCRLFERGVLEPLPGRTASGAESQGKATVYEIFGPGPLHLAACDTTWDTGERDVRALLRYDSSDERFDGLREGPPLRVVSVSPADDAVALERVERGLGGAARLLPTTVGDLERATGVPVAEILSNLFGARCSTIDQALPRTRGARSRPCVVFPSATPHAPVAVFVLTRVLPLAGPPNRATSVRPASSGVPARSSR